MRRGLAAVVAFVAVMASGLLWGGAQALAASNTPLVVGLLLPPDEPEAVSIRQGTLAAAEEANESSGPRVRIAVRGKKGPWGSDASEAALLVMDDGASALIAPTGGAASHLVLQVSGRTALPVASLCPDASVTRASIPWMVRVVPSTLDEARLIFSDVPSTRWLAFVPAGRAGREALSDLASALSATSAASATSVAPAGTRSIARSVETEDGVIADAAVRGILSSVRPEAILLWLPPAAAGRLARSLRGAGFRGPLAGPGRLASGAFGAEAGSFAEGVLVPSIAPGPASEAFEARYRRSFGADPDLAAALAHDAALLLIRAVRSAGTAEPGRAFAGEKPLPGATGLLTFDRHGNRLVRLRLCSYRSGRLVRL